MDRVGTAQWANFEQLMLDAHDTFNQDTLIWHRYIDNNVPMFNEDKPEFNPTNDVSLKVLVGYNFFRTWPITRHSSPGELDNQNMVVLINKQYLASLGYINSDGYFDFNPASDKFTHLGILYKAEGDTAMSQAHNTPLHIQLVLRREEKINGV